ncbi:hypothetical protein Ancab_020632 [Ancistrocladus abbreviatus]
MGAFISRFCKRRGEEASASASASAHETAVTAFHSTDAWKAHFEASKQSNKLMVIDFSASWCPPCRFMEPIVDGFSTTYTDVEFIKIDVDELEGVSTEFGVEAMPTFVFVKKGKEVDRIVGANKDELQQKIEKHRI